MLILAVKMQSLLLLLLPLVPMLTPSAFAEADSVEMACRATELPALCVSAMRAAHAAESGDAQEMIETALSLARGTAARAEAVTAALLAHSRGGGANAANLSAAAANCVEFAQAAQDLISRSAAPGAAPADAQAWMGAAVAYMYDCGSALRYVNTSAAVGAAIAVADSATNHSSNALCMVRARALYGGRMDGWQPPFTERQRPLPLLPLGMVPDLDPDALAAAVEGLALAPNVIVSKRGGGRSSSIQQAVDEAPSHSPVRYVIRIEEGVYDEIVRVPRSKPNLAFVGAGIDRTIIRGSPFVPSLPGPVTIYDAAVVGVNGDGFVAADLSIENTYAGVRTHQGVALRADSDRSWFYQCAFKGHQDTLYAHVLRQYYQGCRIDGTHDFVFGNSAAYFYGCNLTVVPRLDPQHARSGEKDPVTAQGRTDPAQATGFVFESCRVDGSEEYLRQFRQRPGVHQVFLGRPWKAYSRTVFVRSFLGQVLVPDGWMPWNASFALSTLFYGEFRSFGPGARPAARVPWSSQISASGMPAYSVPQFIQGHLWLPRRPPPPRSPAGA